MSKTILNITRMSIAVIVSKLLTTVTTFTLARLFLPEVYGIWTTCLLIISLSSIFCLGTVEALVKNLPYYKGKNSLLEVMRLEANVLGSVILSSLLVLILAVLVNYTQLFKNLNHHRYYIVITIIISSISLLSSFYYFRLTAYQNFKMVSTIDISRSVLFIVLIPLAILKDLNGAILGLLLIQILILGISYIINIKFLGKVKPAFKIFDILILIKIGLPITLIWWVFMLQTSAGRLITITMLGKAAAGYYGLGTNFLSILVLIPMAIGRVLYPKINEEVGRADNIKIEHYVITPTYMLVMIIPIILNLFIIFSPQLITKWFPKYISGINALHILFIGFFFVTINRNSINYLVAKNMQNMILKFVIISMIVNVFVSLVLIKAGAGINGVAFGTTISGVLLSTQVWYKTLESLRSENIIKELFFLYLPSLFPAITTIMVQSSFFVHRQREYNYSILLSIISLLSYIGFLLAIPNYRKRIKIFLVIILQNCKINNKVNTGPVKSEINL